MKIKWGALVVDGRNKIGGHVASANRGGAYLRTKVSPKQPASTYTAHVRAVFSAISSAWRGLTNAQRTAWNNAVQDFKKSDIFGDIKIPSGFNLYQKLNNNLLAIGQPVITTPPSPAAVAAMESLSVTAVNSTGAVTITYSPAIPADMTFKVFATDSQNAGKSFVKNKFRLIGVMATAQASPFTATTMYNAKFGHVGGVGKKVYIQLVGVNETTGQEGIAAQAVAVIS